MSTHQISYKTGAGKLFTRHAPRDFIKRALNDDIQAVRLPATYKGQRHLPGYLWMSRMNALVAYESRLEMVTLLRLDFDEAVSHVVSQPFVLHYDSESSAYRHTPDFFVRYSDGSAEIVNVKPKKFIQEPKNLRAFEACSDVATEMACAYSTRSEMDATYLANLTWLSGYRRTPPLLDNYVESIINAAEGRTAIREIFTRIEANPALIRPVLFHLLWTGTLATDLYTRLSQGSLIWVSKQIERS